MLPLGDTSSHTPLLRTTYSPPLLLTLSNSSGSATATTTTITSNITTTVIFPFPSIKSHYVLDHFPKKQTFSDCQKKTFKRYYMPIT